MEKNLYIISGCNGAGKTTASYTILPEILKCKEFVNADEIAKGLSPFNPEGVAAEAGRIMLNRIEELLSKGITFAIETTLATKSFKNLITKAQISGYKVHLIFFWLENPDLAVQRVKERVLKGGHNIPTEVIFRRYGAGITNLFKIYLQLVDIWMIYDNSKPPRQFVAYGAKDVQSEILSHHIFNKIKRYVK